MDTAPTKETLENELRAIEIYLDHPISRRILADNSEEQEKCINIICNVPTTMDTLPSHFEAVGHLRGLRRSKSILDESVEEIKQQLKEI